MALLPGILITFSFVWCSRIAYLYLSIIKLCMKIITFIIFVLSCFSTYAQLTSSIRLNQVGFYPLGPKIAAIVNSNAATFAVRTENGDSVYGGTLAAAKTWNLSNESIKIADFSSFTATGRYYVSVQGLGNSFPFRIEKNVLVPLNKALMKSYYFSRTSTALPAEFAGQWARAAGHPDLKVVVHPSAASAARPAGTLISCPKGWYDAGDYNSYIVNSGISTYSLLIAYEHFKPYYDTLKLNIPESSNALPDILDEIKWNLDWMLTMQDPNDGGVYNKKTNADFDGSVMPDHATTTRYVVTKSTGAAHDFAAVMAVAYRMYKDHIPRYADSCLNAAKRAYAWGVANPGIAFSNPAAQDGYPEITTGGYGDGNLSDELEWASNELYIATKDESYYASGFKNTNQYTLPGWPSVRTLGLLSLLYHRKQLTTKAFADTTNMKNKLLTLTNNYVTYQKNTSPYKIVMGQANGDFTWGSNGIAGNQAMLLVNAFLLTKNNDYIHAALAQIDYLTGRNATNYSFVTGIGSKPPMNIHHRPSEADDNVDPVPGWVAGGPTGSTGDGCPSNATLLATSYADQQACYTKNEVAINWNAPAVYATGAFEALRVFIPSPQISASVEEDYPSSRSTLAAYPVPSAEVVTLSIKVLSGAMATLFVTDAMGKTQKKTPWMLQTGDNEMTLDVSNLSSGIYMVQVDLGNQVLKRKIVVGKK
jgi:endoglucanase